MKGFQSRVLFFYNNLIVINGYVILFTGVNTHVHGFKQRCCLSKSNDMTVLFKEEVNGGKENHLGGKFLCQYFL